MKNSQIVVLAVLITPVFVALKNSYWLRRYALVKSRVILNPKSAHTLRWKVVTSLKACDTNENFIKLITFKPKMFLNFCLISNVWLPIWMQKTSNGIK